MKPCRTWLVPECWKGAWERFMAKGFDLTKDGAPVPRCAVHCGGIAESQRLSASPFLVFDDLDLDALAQFEGMEKPLLSLAGEKVLDLVRASPRNSATRYHGGLPP